MPRPPSGPKEMVHESISVATESQPTKLAQTIVISSPESSPEPSSSSKRTRGRRPNKFFWTPGRVQRLLSQSNRETSTKKANAARKAVQRELSADQGVDKYGGKAANSLDLLNSECNGNSSFAIESFRSSGQERLDEERVDAPREPSPDFDDPLTMDDFTEDSVSESESQASSTCEIYGVADAIIETRPNAVLSPSPLASVQPTKSPSHRTNESPRTPSTDGKNQTSFTKRKVSEEEATVSEIQQPKKARRASNLAGRDTEETRSTGYQTPVGSVIIDTDKRTASESGNEHSVGVTCESNEAALSLVLHGTAALGARGGTPTDPASDELRETSSQVQSTGLGQARRPVDVFFEQRKAEKRSIAEDKDKLRQLKDDLETCKSNLSVKSDECSESDENLQRLEVMHKGADAIKIHKSLMKDGVEEMRGSSAKDPVVDEALKLLASLFAVDSAVDSQTALAKAKEARGKLDHEKRTIEEEIRVLEHKISQLQSKIKKSELVLQEEDMQLKKMLEE